MERYWCAQCSMHSSSSSELTNRLVAPEQQLATSSAQQQQQPSLRYDRSSSGSGGAGPPSSGLQKKAKHDSAARHIQAKAQLQQTLTKLQMNYPNLLPRTQGSAQQQSSNAERLYRVYQMRNSLHVTKYTALGCLYCAKVA